MLKVRNSTTYKAHKALSHIISNKLAVLSHHAVVVSAVQLERRQFMLYFWVTLDSTFMWITSASPILKEWTRQVQTSAATRELPLSGVWTAGDLSRRLFREVSVRRSYMKVFAQYEQTSGDWSGNISQSLKAHSCVNAGMTEWKKEWIHCWIHADDRECACSITLQRWMYANYERGAFVWSAVTSSVHV